MEEQIVPALNRESIRNKAEWEKIGIRLPDFDYDELCRRTQAAPRWVHIGPGNLFRGYIAALQQKVIEAGKTDTGIIAVSTFDNQVIEKIYEPYDNLALQVVMHADGRHLLADACKYCTRLVFIRYRYCACHSHSCSGGFCIYKGQRNV